MARNLNFAQYALLLAKSGGDLCTALELAETSTFPQVASVLKAAVGIGSTTDPEYTALLEHRLIADGFVESLKSASVFEALYPFARRVPFRTRFGVITQGFSGHEVLEPLPKPITKLAIAGDEPLDPIQCVSLTVITDELLRFQSSVALGLLDSELRKAVSATQDAAFIRQILLGANPVTVSGSGFPAQFKALLDAVNTSATGAHFLITKVENAIALATTPSAASANEFAYPEMTPLGGRIQGVQVLVTDSMPEISTIGAPEYVLVDAAQLAMYADSLRLASSNAATLRMADDPAAGPDSLTSLFQTNSIAMRAERLIGAKALRASAVAFIEAQD